MPQYQGVWSLQQQMQALTSGQWATDPLFDYTTLLLQGDAGANGAQNNTFYDTSPNQFAITRNGNTTQGTFSPFSATGWSNYFDGASYLTPSSSPLALGTAAYTVEFWIYPTTLAAGGYHVLAANATNGFVVVINNAKIAINKFAVGDVLAYNTALTLNTWTHVALVRTGTGANQTQIYVNGTSVATGTDSNNWTVTSTTAIGANSSGAPSQYITAYLSNLRICGAAVYTSNFTPSTTPLTTTSQGASSCTFLTCQDNRFRDNGSTAATFTVGGTPSVQAFSPFAPQFQYTASGTGGSGYFDGSGDYLTTNNINLAANAFTIEGWFYVTTTAGNMNYWGMTNGGGSTPKAVLYMDNVGNLVFETGAVSGAVISVSISTYVKRNAWQHIAISRSGTGASQTAMFIDGVRVGTGTCASLSGITAGFNIGYVGEGFGVTFNGYIAGFRIVNGTAVYNPASTTVTIPTAPLTAVTNTALLTNFTNAGILDGTMKNNLETVGNAQVSTSVVKYGSGSMYFDGTGDYLRPNSGNIFNFGTGDFTVEFWLYLNSTGNQTFIDCRPGSAGDYMLFDYSSNVLRYYVGSTTVITGSSLSTGQWYHIALSRISGTARMFINGTQTGSTATHTTNLLSSSNPYIASNYVPGDYLNGYLDDMRVTKGIARYTQNFIPPSVALPRQ